MKARGFAVIFDKEQLEAIEKRAEELRTTSQEIVRACVDVALLKKKAVIQRRSEVEVDYD